MIRLTQKRKQEKIDKLIDSINKKHENNLKKLQEYQKEMKLKADHLKEENEQKRKQKDLILQGLEERRKKKNTQYFLDCEKKEQSVIINKSVREQKLKSHIDHENELNQMVQKNKEKIEQNNEQKKIDLQNKMDDLDQRVTNYKKNVEYESLKKLQESYVKQTEKDLINRRTRRMKEYRYEIKCKEIEDKEKRIELMKNEKQKFQDEKDKLNKELQNQRESVINKFNIS